MSDDADVMMRWLVELSAPTPDCAVVAALEAEAETRGWDPLRALNVLIAAPGSFDPDLHPRGRDGKFIEKLGLVKLLGTMRTPEGKKIDLEGQRGKVTDIVPNRHSPGNPDIRVQLLSDRRGGKPGRTVTVKPNQVLQAPEKARLDGDRPAPNPAPDMNRSFGPGRPNTQPPPPAKKPDFETAVRDLVPFDANAERDRQDAFNDAYMKRPSRGPIDDHVGNYIDWGYLDLNQGLSSGNLGPELQEEVNGLDKVINDLGSTPPPLVRGLAHDGPMPELDWPVGHEFTVPGYGSWTSDPKTALDFAKDKGSGSVVMRLTNPDAVKGIPGKERENETILPHGLTYRVVGADDFTAPDGTKRRVLDVEVVDPNAARRRELQRQTRGMTDEALAAEQTSPDADFATAIATEQANRARRRAEDEARRQQLMDDVNAAAANLSKTDPEERARGLDDILAKLRFSIIDTDKVHDHIYPPGESGRWTAERNQQHEEMWDDLLAQVQASTIPKDRDALVLGGLPGAGKSYTLRPGQKAAGFGVTAWEPGSPMPDGATHVSINPDIVKEMLIARGMLPEGISDDLKPMEQVTFLHEESSYVAKVFSKRLGDLGYNVVLDNTMDSEGGMLKRMTPLARQGYKFRGLFVDIPVEESKASATQRYLDAALTPQGGRFVPSSVQGNRTSTKGNMSKNRDAMDNLVEQDWFTDWLIVDNTGISNRTPKGEIVGQGTGAGSAADRYLPGNEAAVPKAGPQAPSTPEAPPTIEVPSAPAAPSAPPAI